jgi:hypothetical protein
MKLKNMSVKWLNLYLSLRFNLDGTETKQDLLWLCKILGIPDDISPSTFERTNKQLKNR